MVTCIAAATRSDGGAFEGVAPEAGIASYRTRFYDTELTTIYDLLVDRVEEGDVVVATNSFGVRAGSPPPLDPTSTSRSRWRRGQHFGDPGMSRKPDVTAPTPANGRVLYGSEVRSLSDGWGTSGACSQVAGLAALLRFVRPQVQTLDVLETIRTTAVSLGHHPHCEGYGLIDCAGALGGA